MNDVAQVLLRINLVGGLVVLAVLAVRLPMRRWLGPQAAYRLWAAPPLAVFATLLPARVIWVDEPVAAGGGWTAALGGTAPLLLALWLAGALAAVGFLWRAQAAFLAEARAGRAGPAVVGVICPRIVMPLDDSRYTPEERALVRAHEREHIDRRDPQAGGWMAAFQCLAWFNPLVHLAVHLARLDQELACDAAAQRQRQR
ncbi:MAG: M56 family metallopeptidase, partial [Phenylobacterium sp.]